MSMYDVAGHALLSPEAAQLGPTELEQYTTASEVLLGLNKLPLFTGDDLDRAKGAIAMQVSYLVESGIEGFILEELWRGARRATFRGGSRRMPPIHSAARKIISRIRPRPEGSIAR